MELNRDKENKWIFQKNINSNELIKLYINALKKQDNKINYETSLKYLKEINGYKGRSEKGTTNTLGVRMSQMCFYMLGYKTYNKEFIPSVSSQIYEKDNSKMDTVFLINLFSMQFPNPYSKTPTNFKIYIGRLILKLLLEDRINKKIYIDEFIWFLPFIEKINEDIYENLISEILKYREKTYEEKLKLFTGIKNYNSLFANVLHECLYYFVRIFEGFDVLKTIEDINHNEGNLFYFIHGKDTIRNDAVKSRGKYSGYIELNEKLINYSKILLENHSFSEEPLTENESLNKEDWIKELYEFKMLEYYYDIDNYNNNILDLKHIITDMVKQSKYGSNDGKSFEESLKNCFELFREIDNVEIKSGAGDTDLLCNITLKEEAFKFNVDAKKSSNRLQSINPIRIRKHQQINKSKYTVIVSPRFSKGAKEDIENFNIVTIKAETLANYCLKECLSSQDGLANFEIINDVILKNYGKDITNNVEDLIIDKYCIR